MKITLEPRETITLFLPRLHNNIRPLVDGLLKLNLKVSILVLREGVIEDHSEIDYIKLRCFTPMKQLFSLINKEYKFQIPSPLQVYTHFKIHRPSYLLVRNDSNFAYCVVLFFGLIFKSKILMYNQYPLVKPGIKKNLYNYFFYYLLNIRTISPVLNKVSIMPEITISETPEEYRKRLQNYSNANYKNRSMWFPFGGGEDDLKINKINSTDGIKILSIGKFEKRKNMDKALSALNKVSIRQNKKIIFTIIGEYDVSKKPYFDYLNRIANKYNTDSFQVSVIVNMSRNDLRKEFLKTHYFILLSEQEIASYSQLEAFLYGCKVVVFYDNGFLNFLPYNSNYTVLYRKENFYQDLNNIIFNNEIAESYEYVAEYLKLFNNVFLASKLLSFFKQM